MRELSRTARQFGWSEFGKFGHSGKRALLSFVRWTDEQAREANQTDRRTHKQTVSFARAFFKRTSLVQRTEKFASPCAAHCNSSCVCVSPAPFLQTGPGDPKKQIISFIHHNETTLLNGYCTMVPPPPKPPVICYDLAERNRQARQHSDMRKELDKVTIMVESLKRAQNQQLETYGLSHNSAKYIQKLEEDYGRLRQKYNQMLATRKHEAIKFSQHLRQCQQMNTQPKTIPPARDTPTPTPPPQPLDFKHSTPTNCVRPNTSSTLAAVGGGSGRRSFIGAHQPRTTKIGGRRDSQGNSRGSSSTVSITSSSLSSLDKSPPTSKSYENDTLEITDMRFFEKVEDMTMLEVEERMKRLGVILKENGLS